MSQDEAFLQAIREEPDDDAVRLIYADWLQEHGDAPACARGQFIRSQCQRANPDVDRERRRAMVRDEMRLLREHWDAWLRPLRTAVGPDEVQWFHADFHSDALGHFRRGFVEALTLPAVRFLDHAPAILKLTPLRDLAVTAVGTHAVSLALCPHLAELTRLSFADYYSQPLDHLGALALASSPYLTRLTTLSLQRNNVGDEGVAALAATEWLAGVTWLDLSDNGLSAAGVGALARSPRRPRLEVLRLGNNFPGADGVEALAESSLLLGVQSLDLSRCELTDRDAAVLAASPFLRRVLDLDLSRNRFGPEGQRILREHFGDRVWL
jgi:uncharacterized protein (TIGR02996 family)